MNLRSATKKKVGSAMRRIARSFGYDLRPLSRGPRKLRTKVGESYSLVRGLGFRPSTVIDVGAASGTMELHTAFPDAYFLLIEPLKAFEPHLVSVLERYRGSYVLAAASGSPGSATFNVHDHFLYGSSLYKESMGGGADGREVTVPTVRIDDIVREKGLDGPYLIKVDVQGAELDVLDGAPDTLLQTEAVVLEVSLFGFMKGAPQFYDVVSYMKERGFVAYDIVLGWNRPLDDALGQVDIMFVKESGRFRKDHSYSTLSQLKELCDV